MSVARGWKAGARGDYVRRSLHCEGLEGRRLLAIFNPISYVTDGGANSLRAAVIAANANGQNDTINLTAGIYKIGISNNSGMQENSAVTGDFDLTESGHTLTIRGQGAGSIIDAQQLDRAFQVFPNVTVVLSNLVVRNGSARDDGTSGATFQSTDFYRGGALLTAAGSNVTLNNVLVEQSRCIGIFRYPAAGPASQGGGIYAAGNLSLNASLIAGNIAQGGYTSSGGSVGAGGGIFNADTSHLELRFTTVSGNSAIGVAGSSGPGGIGQGGGICALGPADFANSQLVGNAAAGGTSYSNYAGAAAQGGGLFADGAVSTTNTTIAANSAAGGTGSQNLVGSAGFGASGGEGQGGGCFATVNSSLTISSTTFDGNFARGGRGGDGSVTEPAGPAGPGGFGEGGGLSLYGMANLMGSTLSNNSALGGVGPAGSESSEAFTGGLGGAGGEAQGGGIRTWPGSTLTLSQVIVTGNSALGNDGGAGGSAQVGGPGGPGGQGIGGGICVASSGGVAGSAGAVNVTIANNTAQGGAGGQGYSSFHGGNGGRGGTALGGGIYTGRGSSFSLTSTTISYDQAIGGVGGIPGDGSIDLGGNGGLGGTATGGGLHIERGTALVTNCTVSSNYVFGGNGRNGGHSSDDGGGNGGDGGDGLGGGVFVSTSGGVLLVNNSTIAGNSAVDSLAGSAGSGSSSNGAAGTSGIGGGGGVWNVGTVYAVSTIFADNLASQGPDFLGTLYSSDHNLIESTGGTSGFGASDIVDQDAKLGDIQSNGGLTETHVPRGGSPAINAGVNPLALTTDQRGLPRAVKGIDIGAVEFQAPRVVLSGINTFVENAISLVLAPSAGATDSDNPDFNGGNLAVTITTNANTNDRLQIKNQGMGAGQIGISGSNVSFGGKSIGTFGGGTGSAPLVVTFTTADATPAAAQALVRAITFRTVTENPSTATRTITFKVNDGDGFSSNPAVATKTVKVTAVNDAPVLAFSGTSGYAHDGPAIVLAPFAAVNDVDSTDLGGGRLRARIIDGADTSNRLTIGSGFTVDASGNVLQGSTIIGKRTSNGFGTNELVITFNASATPSVVQQLVRAITFKTVGGSAGQRKVVFTVSDGDGGLSAEATKTVNVT